MTLAIRNVCIFKSVIVSYLTITRLALLSALEMIEMHIETGHV
jgi:hypothetical protein